MTTATTTTTPTTTRRARASLWSLVVVSLALLSTCGWFVPKVPITDVGAFFSLADATWFEREQTLFFFWTVDAQQGLSDFSQIEIAWTTDDGREEFAATTALPMVHEHRALDCGPRQRCGSASVHVEKLPRDVQMRLRYHEDGELTLDAGVALNIVAISQPWNDRSAVVYGVFADGNRDVQWRLRHQFPALRNEQVEALGLRRRLIVEDQAHGSLRGIARIAATNPYAYAFAQQCPAATYADLGFADFETSDRARFAEETLPLSTSTSAEVCARVTVFDALGPYAMAALARKNPQVGAAFPTLRTPVRAATEIPFFFETCNDIGSELHRQMQLQRTLMSESDVVCIDDWQSGDFVGRLARRLQDRIDVVRTAGNDMVLKLGLQRADQARGAAVALEAALATVVAAEQDKSTPRLAGAFVFDSTGYGMSSAEVSRNTLWCPSAFGGGNLDDIDNVSSRSCAVQLNGDTVLGPLRIASLPILPTRTQYLTFVDNVGEAQAGSMKQLTFRAPTRTPQSENVPLEGFGLATFFNNEAVSAADDDSFSYCANDDVGTVVFRAQFDDGETVQDVVLPLSVLPDVHDQQPQGRYALGLAWDFPYLVQLEYETFAAGAVTVADFTIPFGFASPAEAFFGSGTWFQDDFDLTSVLLRCDRFCSHPTFDNAGVYNVRAAFDEAYRTQCYRPLFPTRNDGGSPRDP
ncbi:MAG TPA: hypothetical protein VGF99_06295 [Myxococcota bacterium]